MGGEEDIGAAGDGGDGEDIPGVGGDDVGGDEVNLVAAVGMAVGVEVAFVGIAAMKDGAFHPFGRWRSLRAGYSFAQRTRFPRMIIPALSRKRRGTRLRMGQPQG